MEPHVRVSALLLALTGCIASHSNRSAATGLPGQHVERRPNEIKRTLLAQGDVAGRPGFESRLYLVEYPPETEGPLHVHTEQCVGYVIAGQFLSAFGKDPPALTRAGQGFIDRPHEPHRFTNPDPHRPLQFVVTGMFRKDEPLFWPVEDTDHLGSISASSSAFVEPAPAVSSNAPLAEVRRSLLAQKDIADLPGLESRLYLMEFPPGAASKAHIHTSQGLGYVLEGTFESSFGDGPVTSRHAGDGFVDVVGKPHHFRNPDSARPLRFVFAGTFHKDEPLFQLAPQ